MRSKESDVMINNLESHCSESFSMPTEVISGGVKKNSVNSVSNNLDYCVPKDVMIARDNQGNPVFSLTLVLSRQPEPKEDSIYPLIMQGILNMSVTLKAPKKAITDEGYNKNMDKPLFAREALFEWVQMHETYEKILDKKNSIGIGCRSALNAVLNRQEVLDVLSALECSKSTSKVRVNISYRAEPSKRYLRLYGSWREIYDFLSVEVDSDTEVAYMELKRLFYKMLDRNIIKVYKDKSNNLVDEFDKEQIFKTFLSLSTVILHKSKPSFDGEINVTGYLLGDRPHEKFYMDYKFIATEPNIKHLTINTPIEKIIGGILDGLDRERFIQIIAPDSQGNNGFAKIPRLSRFKAKKATSSESRTGTLPLVKLAEIDGSIKSLSLAVKPDHDKLLKPNMYINSGAVAPVGNTSGPLRIGILDDLNVKLSDVLNKISLPVIDDSDAPIWIDSKDKNTYWYAPVFELVNPDSTQDVDNSPFLFEFKRAGVTASAEVMLKGTVRFTLRTKMSDAAKKALEKLNGVKTLPAPTNNISVILELPFMDKNDGKEKIHSLVSDIQYKDDNITAVIKLTGDWVRLCYSVLSNGNLHEQKARLCIAYSHPGYYRIRQNNIKLTFGAKEALIPVVYSSDRSGRSHRTPYFDAINAAYRHPVGDMHFKREALSSSGSLLPVPITRPLIKPVVNNDNIPEYGTRTFIHEERHEVLYPCNNYGTFYREIAGDNYITVGCSDALKLGETKYRLYKEVQNISHSRYRVYRSLQQPDRFLVVPAYYRITRYSSSSEDTKAYRPDILVYSTTSSENSSSDLIVFYAGLEPDIPPYVRRDLQEKLEEIALEPKIEYPTQISADTEYKWNIPGNANVNTVKTPEMFQVSIETDIPGVMIIKNILSTSGILGSVKFNLQDGTHMESTLSMELADITGPWDTGPLETVILEESVRITNRIERAVMVSELMVYRNGIKGQDIAIDIALSEGESLSVPLPELVNEVYPIYSVPPSESADIEEIRSYIEDVYTNIIFVDLVNYEKHKLSKIEIRARIMDSEGIFKVPMSGDPPVGEIKIMLPLIQYLEKTVLQYEVKKTFKSGEVSVSSWLNWNLTENGNVVSLVWDKIQ